MENGRSGCGGCPFSRRSFLAASSAAGILAAPGAGWAKKAGRKTRVKLIYALHATVQDRPDWPNLGFDFGPVMERNTNLLQNALPDFEIMPSVARGAAEAMRIMAGDATKPVDGYIVYELNNWKMVFPAVAAAGKPTLLVNFPYGGTGGFLVFAATSLRNRSRNVGFVSSSNPDDLIAAVKCFEGVKPGADFAGMVARSRAERTPLPGDLSCLPDAVDVASPDEAIAAMKKLKILAVGYPGVSLRGIGLIPVKKISFAELDAAYQAANREAAGPIAERWKQNAEAVEGVSDATLLDSAAMYLAMKDLQNKHGANAITVDCLQGFYGDKLHAYPCLGFYEMYNEGLVGACECDVKSTATMLAVTALTRGRPGYISDPDIDTSKRRITYAHCVASNRPFGPDGAVNPYQILTHSEDRKGASVRSLLPSGYLTSTMEFDPDRRQVLFHQAKAVDNDPDDRACRTKLAAEPVGDLEKLFTQWDRWGWHRVTYYGDLLEPVRALASALKYRLVMEA